MPNHHDIEMPPDPITFAQVTAALIRGDRRTNTTEPPSLQVRFVEDPRGQDRWMAPKTLNKEGKGDCSSIVRAAGAYAPATHVIVIHMGPGELHAALLKADDAPNLQIVNGRIVSGLTDRAVYDPCVLRGMNGGHHLPLSAFAHGWTAPIWVDFETVPAQRWGLPIAGAPLRAADADYAHGSRGTGRRHMPVTGAGRAVASIAQEVAGRLSPRSGGGGGGDDAPHLDNIGHAIREATHQAVREGVTDVDVIAQRAEQGARRAARVALEAMRGAEASAEMARRPADRDHVTAFEGMLLEELRKLQGQKAQADQGTLAAHQALIVLVRAGREGIDHVLRQVEARLAAGPTSAEDPAYDGLATGVSEIGTHLPGLLPDSLMSFLRSGDDDGSSADPEAPAADDLTMLLGRLGLDGPSGEADLGGGMYSGIRAQRERERERERARERLRRRPPSPDAAALLEQLGIVAGVGGASDDAPSPTILALLGEGPSSAGGPYLDAASLYQTNLDGYGRDPGCPGSCAT